MACRRFTRLTNAFSKKLENLKGALAAEHVEHDVQVEVGPPGRAEQLGDVPTPQLVGPPCQQLGGRVARVPQLISPLAHLVVLREDAIHRALRTEIPAL